MRKKGLQTLKPSCKKVSRSLSRTQRSTRRPRKPFKANWMSPKLLSRSSNSKLLCLNRRMINNFQRSWRRVKRNSQAKKVWLMNLKRRWKRALKPSCKSVTTPRRPLLWETRRLSSSPCNSRRLRTNWKSPSDSMIRWSRLWTSNKSILMTKVQLHDLKCYRRSSMPQMRLILLKSKKSKQKMMT